ncbi:MAG: putative integrase [Prokaryotic dsDNA virus sp.]|nr:MAG: putative integrase [Prokaryotic dsDNA virus sp.]|tara:strand:+ start:2634 stop:3668 length:1035 start_codon:yes stop_codon:yes gene_type:complete
MTISARDKGFQATVNHKGQRWRKQFKTYEDAEVWEAQAKADVVAGRVPDMGGTERGSDERPKTLGQMIEYVSTRYWSDSKSGSGLKRNAEIVGGLIGMGTLVRDIDLFAIDRVILALKDHGNSNATINRKLASLSKCLTVAKDIGVIDSKPKVQRLREGVNRLRWFTDKELKEMVAYFDHLGHPNMGHWVRFQADTGLRVSETRGLEWRDIQGGVVILSDTKSESPRGVPLTQAAQAALGAMDSSAKGPFEWTTKHHLRNYWDRLRLHMDWPATGQEVMHALRHTFCSRLVQRGVPILTVKELAGHKTIEVTLRYAHLAPHNLVSAIGLLEPNRSSGPMLDVVA